MWLLLLSLVGCGGDAGRRDADGDADADADADSDSDTDADSDSDADAQPFGCSDLYAEGLLPTFEVEISAEDWGEIEDEFVNWADREAQGLPVKAYHPIVFRYTPPGALSSSEEVREDAAIRLKGNPCCSWWGGKMQFVISWNEVDPDARFHGLRKTSLDAPPYDPSLLHDRLALAYLRDLGLPAACANHARLMVNGELYGVYTHIEHVDREFLERVFDDPEGNLYKYGWELRTNEDTADTSDRDLFWSTYDIPGLEAIADLDEIVAEWAAEAMIPDGDGYWAGSGNIYLYNEPGRGWVFIPWDLDLAFDFVPVDANPITYRADWGGQPAHFGAVLGDAGWYARWLDALEAAWTGYNVATLWDRLDRWSAQIDRSMEEDPNRPYTIEEHRAAVQALRDYVRPRRDYVGRWIACMRGDGLDDDEDGSVWCQDCNDADPSVHPGAAEVCNGLDDDCSGLPDDSDECPDCVEQELDGTRFAFCTRPRSWYVAEAECESQGGALAVPLDDAENQFALATIPPLSPDNWWIGANDFTTEGTWTAPDGTELSYVAWGPDRPNGGTDQNCVVVDQGLEGGWNDKACAEEHPAICRLP